MFDCIEIKKEEGERMKTSKYGKWVVRTGAIIIGVLFLIVAYILLPQHPHKEISESYYNQLNTWWGEHPQVRGDITEAAKSDLMITYSEYDTIKQKVRRLRFSVSKEALYEDVGGTMTDDDSVDPKRSTKYRETQHIRSYYRSLVR